MMNEEQRDTQVGNVNESLIRLEAKIDVVLGRHEGKIDELTRRQGETTSTLREHDGRITANALTTAETRQQIMAVANDVHQVETVLSKRGSAITAWVAVAVAGLAVILDPILNSLISSGKP